METFLQQQHCRLKNSIKAALTGTFLLLVLIAGTAFESITATDGQTNAHTSGTGTFTVGTTPLSVVANAQSKTYGTASATGAGSLLFTPTGLMNGETIGSVTIAISNSGALATAAAGGSYT